MALIFNFNTNNPQASWQIVEKQAPSTSKPPTELPLSKVAISILWGRLCHVSASSTITLMLTVHRWILPVNLHTSSVYIKIKMFIAASNYTSYWPKYNYFVWGDYRNCVVICFQKIVSLFLRTTIIMHCYRLFWLWFAFKKLYLCSDEQH